MSRDQATTRTAIVDRIDDDTAVLDVLGQALRLPRAFLPTGVAEGDGLRIIIARDAKTSTITVKADPGASAGARAETEALLKRLREA